MAGARNEHDLPGTLRPAAAVASLIVLLALPQAAAEEYLSFDSRRVLDLSGALSDRGRLKFTTRPVSIDSVTRQTGSIASVLERAEVRRGDPGVMSANASKKDEARRMADRRSGVSRKGKVLTIASRAGAPLQFRDWVKPATSEADGDEESFIYAGRLKETGYHKVDVHFGHDSPGAFLVHSRSGKLLFAHVEDDLASLSADRSRLLVVNSGLNPPFGLILATLRQEGPAVRLHCLSEGGQRIIPTFRGWHASPAIGFDLVLVARQPGEQEAYEAMPMRFIYLNNEWRALVLDAERLQQATGLNCWQ
ncbi:MAG TPA: hypothetical protein VF460_03620 [Burkholderiales bacterium]